MAEGGPLYRPAADVLPTIYQEDAGSWEQVSSYLGLADDLLRAYLAALEDLPGWLSPHARELRPPGLGAGLPAAGAPATDAERQLTALSALYAELAGWFGFAEFPRSWRKETDPEATLDKEQAFVERAARIWRERGTPRGFLAWLAFWFDLTPADVLLLEHFKYRDDETYGKAGDTRVDPWAHQVTLLVSLDAFPLHERRRELVHFVARHAPAHLLVRVCWVTAEQLADVCPGDVDGVRKTLREVESFVKAEEGFTLGKCPLESAPPKSRLGFGVLPGGGIAK
jgi:hypothetical protein